MVRQKITTYAMLTLQRRYQIEQEIRARRAARAARIAVGLSSDSPKPEEQAEEEGGEEHQPAPMEMAEAEQPEQELAPAPGFNMQTAEAEFAVTQADKMAEQQAILESIQDGAYMEANRQFIRQERAATDALFDEVEAEMGLEADAEEPEEPREPELRLPPMCLEQGTEIVDISDED